jgi:hypothetical protein
LPEEEAPPSSSKMVICPPGINNVKQIIFEKQLQLELHFGFLTDITKLMPFKADK